ncbi:MAG: hypothetical protein WB792_04845 [Desulfobacterales bacterium]
MASCSRKLTLCIIISSIILTLGSVIQNAGAKQQTPVTIDKIMAHLAFDKSYKKALLNGKILSTGMPEMEQLREELAVSAVMLVVRAPMEKVVAAYLDGASFRQDDDIIAYHMIQSIQNTGRPAQEDFKAIGFTEEESSEVKKLMDFKGGDTFNFSRDEIEQFRGVDPKDPAVQEKASSILRRILAERCQSYFSRGLLAVKPYARDRDKQSFPGRELTVAVASTQLLEKHFPDFYQSLLKYPEDIGKNIQNDFYWFKNRLDHRPVFQLCHYMTDIRDHYAIVAELQFYVEHTYNAMLTVIGCVPYEDGTVVFCINRTFTDQVAGFGSSIKRTVGRRRIEDSISKYFAKLRRMLEAGEN